MRVELLYTEADPTYMQTRQILVEVLTEDAFETPIQMIAVASPEDAELLRFPGSPTIRIDGVDIAPIEGPPTLADRAFPRDGDPDGTADASLPGRDLIRRAVERARGWSHGRRPPAGRT